MNKERESLSSRTLSVLEASFGKARGVSPPLARPKGNYFSEEGLVISSSRTKPHLRCAHRLLSQPKPGTSTHRPFQPGAEKSHREDEKTHAF